MSRPVRSLALDLGLALVVTAAGLAEAWVPFSSRQGDGSLPAVSACIVVAGLALTQRRTHPLLAGLVVLWAWPAVFAFTSLHVLFFGQFVPMVVALYSMARHGRGRVPFLGAAAGASTLLYFDLLVEELQTPGEVVFHWGVFTIAWSFGWAMQRFERRAVESTRRAVEAEVAAAERALAAVVEERTRIARELHDVVAHAVSVMVVQAGAAEQVVDDDPAYARRALGTIRATGTQALAEMRRVVAVLRDADEPGALSPQPGLGALPGLVADTEAAGLTVVLEQSGVRRDLPAGVDLAAYRIVQEALTNVRRHAGATTVRLRVEHGDDEVRIEVADDGRGRPVTVPASGHGLAGMRERAALYGGSVEVVDGGEGFVVRAVLPVGSAS